MSALGRNQTPQRQQDWGPLPGVRGMSAVGALRALLTNRSLMVREGLESGR